MKEGGTSGYAESATVDNEQRTGGRHVHDQCSRGLQHTFVVPGGLDGGFHFVTASTDVLIAGAAEFGYSMVLLTAGTPTLSPWGVMSFVALLLVIAVWAVRHQLAAGSSSMT